MTDVVADAYATMADFRLHVRDAATNDADDPDTTLKLIALEAAARAIDVSCNRTFRVAGDTATARYFSPRYGRDYFTSAFVTYDAHRVVCEIADLFDDTGIEVAADSTGNGDWGDPLTTYRLTPLDAPDRPGKPWTGILFDWGTAVPCGTDRLKVTALWGWDAIPNTIRQANLIQAARFYKRRDAAFGVAGSPDLGNELRLLSKLDPDVALMVATFRRYF